MKMPSSDYARDDNIVQGTLHMTRKGLQCRYRQFYQCNQLFAVLSATPIVGLVSIGVSSRVMAARL
jgi:hypothetical protein